MMEGRGTNKSNEKFVIITGGKVLSSLGVIRRLQFANPREFEKYDRARVRIFLVFGGEIREFMK